jgi:hypothetical protein
MRPAIAALAFAALANAIPQGVTSAVSPSSSAPAGCQADYSGSFQITIVNVTTNMKRDLEKREALTLTLSGGILKDQQGRTGYTASNRQFQFDDPPQAGAIYTAGFSICGNGSLALGDSAIWYQCYSGGFYNLYDSNWAPQCSPIYIVAIGGSSGAAAGGSASGKATQASDGQPGQASAATVVPQRSDGQPFASTTAVPQRSDGQPFASVAPVTQLSDGQPQGPAPTANPVSQKSDGQPIASSKSPAVSQQSDGQPVASSAAPISQISDGQPQAPRPSAPPVTIAPEGQPQAATQASRNITSTGTASPSQYTGAATPVRTAGEAMAVIAGLVGAIALL